MELRKYQSEAVSRISKWLQSNIDNKVPNRFCLLQAPTGSGKTVMVSSVIADNPDVAYLFISPGKGGLGMQTFNSLTKYSNGYVTHYANEESVSRLFAVQPSEVMVVSWESINKVRNKLVTDSENRNLFDLLGSTNQSGTEVVLIIDEAHFAKGQMSKAQSFLNQISDTLGYQPMRLEVTATPSDMNVIDTQLITSGEQAHVVVNYADVSDAGMITSEIIVNEGVLDFDEDNPELSSDSIVLTLGLNKIESISSEVPWSAKMLVQIPKAAAGLKYSEQVLSFLAETGRTKENGRVGVYLSEEKVNVDNLNDPDCPVDVILFKEGLTMGWDCPTATVLVSFRESKNSAFKAQVAGRIMRMPEHKHYEQDFLNFGYIYTTLPKEMWTGMSADFDSGYIKDGTLTYRGPVIELPASSSISVNTSQPSPKSIRDALSKSDVARFAIDSPDMIVDASLSNYIVSDAKFTDGVASNDTEDAFINVSDIATNILFKNQLRSIAGDLDPSTLKKALLSWLHGNFTRPEDSFADRAMAAFVSNDEFRAAFSVFVEEFLSTLDTEFVTEEYTWSPPARLAVSTAKTGDVIGNSQTYAYVDSDGCPTFSSELKFRTENRFVQSLDSIKPEWWFKNGDYGSEHFRIDLGNNRDFYPDFILVVDGKPSVFEVKDDGAAIGILSDDARLKAQKLAEWSDETGVAGAIVYYSTKTMMLMAAVSDDINDDIPLSTYMS